MDNHIFAGRKVIKTDAEEITAENVVNVLQESLSLHFLNEFEINYLYQYYKGQQPILNREKEVRKEINNKIVENRANEIVSFKVGYLMGEPVQYIRRGEKSGDDLNKLNEYLFAEDKHVKDKELADWFHICGTSYRMLLPKKTSIDDESPFEIYTLDPRKTFVVYANDLGETPVMGVTYVIKRDDTKVYSIYTRNQYFEIENDRVTKTLENVIGVPIFEYPANAARMGEFETVIPILDAINLVDSNRLDGVEQFIQALMLFHNVKIDEEKFEKLKESGAMAYTDIDAQSKGEIKYLISELNQTQTQNLVDHLYQTVLTICGMPNRNGGSSTSDTGSAVTMRDGWSAAEGRAKNSEDMFKKSEKVFLRKVLEICKTMRNLELKLSQIEIRFTRRNYENITEKANVLVMMLNNNKIHPKYAFAHSGMFIDPEIAYSESMQWAKEQEAKNANIEREGIGNNKSVIVEKQDGGNPPEKK